MVNLNDHKLGGVPDSAYYIPDFVSEQEEQIILNQITKAPKPKWVQLSNRRLQNWGGIPLPKGMIAEPIPDWLKCYVDKVNSISDLFEEEKKANHVLVNEYCPGNGIMPHLDGPLFHPVISTISLGSPVLLDFYNPIDGQDSIESTQFEDRHLFSIYVQPRSLLVLSDQMYEKYLHGIKETNEDMINDKVVQPQKIEHKEEAVGKICDFRNSSNDTSTQSSQIVVQRKTRISLTIRHVPKTKKIKIRL